MRHVWVGVSDTDSTGGPTGTLGGSEDGRVRGDGESG